MLKTTNLHLQQENILTFLYKHEIYSYWTDKKEDIFYKQPTEFFFTIFFIAATNIVFFSSSFVWMFF